VPPLRLRPLFFSAAVGLLLPIAAVECFGATSNAVKRPYASDFALYYGTSTIGLQSGFAHIYDEGLRMRVWASLGTALGGQLQPFPVIQPPTVALFTAPLALLPFHTAYVIWFLLVAAAVLLAWWLAAPGGPWPKAGHLIALMALLPVGLGLSVGQAVFIVFASVLAAWWLLRRRRDVAAGLVLVLILLKPQEAALVPLALLVIGRRRAFVAWAAGAAVFSLGALAAIGPVGLTAYAARAIEVSRHPQGWASVPDLSLPSLLGGGFAGLVSIAVVAAVALFAAWANRERNIELPMAIAVVASLTATPYLHEPDTVMLVAAGWLYVRSAPPSWAIGFLVLGYVLADLGQAPAVGWAPLVVLEVVWLAAIAVRGQPARVLSEASPAPA
jgi:hypothetical protein